MRMILTCSLVCVLIGCASPQEKLGSRAVVIGPDTCLAPRIDVSVAEQEASATADVDKIGKIVEATANYKRKVDLFRKEIPGVNSIAEVEYRLCVAQVNGRITPLQYNEHMDKFVQALAAGGFKMKKWMSPKVSVNDIEEIHHSTARLWNTLGSSSRAAPRLSIPYEDHLASDINDVFSVSVDLVNVSDYDIAFTDISVDFDGVYLRQLSTDEISAAIERRTNTNQENPEDELLIAERSFAEQSFGMGPEAVSNYLAACAANPDSCNVHRGILFEHKGDTPKDLALLEAIKQGRHTASIPAEISASAAETKVWQFQPSATIKLQGEKKIFEMVEALSTNNTGTFNLRRNSTQKVELQVSRSAIENSFSTTWNSAELLTARPSRYGEEMLTYIERNGGNVNLVVNFVNSEDGTSDSITKPIFDRLSDL